MALKAHKAFLTTASLVLLATVAQAQQAPNQASRPQGHMPYEAPRPIELTQTPPSAYRQSIGQADTVALNSALASAKRGDVTGARSAIAMLSDPIAKKIATWALVDSAGDSLSFFELDQARRDLAGWPRAARRQLATEKQLETSGQTPQQIIAWFGGAEPQTAEGAMALASALQATGKSKEAADLIRGFWRDRLFEVGPQRTMLARFGGMLTPDDHARRADILLYGAQGPAAREILILLPPDKLQAAQTRMALRSGAGNANEMVANLPANLANDPGIAFERASYYRQRNLESLALAQVPKFPSDLAHGDMAERIWAERYRLILYALRNSDSAGAYTAAANSGLTSGAPAADAEFYAGWIALTRLKNPAQADIHFANLERIGQSPITRGRALYWRGRAAEGRGDQVAAQAFYGAGAKYNTTFYGQLAGEKVNGGRLVLGSDPVITQADRARFEARDTVRAARLLYDIGNRDLFRPFVLALDDILPTVEEQALLVDLARGYGDQDTSMKVVRTAAQRGFILPERGYPLRNPPQVMGAPEPALTLGITRQESGFDPMARSGADARGMMQLLPATAASEARRLGMGYDTSMLYQPDYNMQLGQAFLGRQINNFSGSYPMAIAAYNAGPGRPPQWVTFCGDPRGSTDPIDFVECIPFSETRNYVMRVMEGMQVYRARLNNGSAPITLTTDLKRGAYGTYAGPMSGPARPVSAGSTSMAPIPNP